MYKKQQEQQQYNFSLATANIQYEERHTKSTVK